MQHIRKILLFLLIIPIVAIVGYYALIFLLGGPALPNFFEIRNNDAGTHEVTVEILDSHNSSIFEESYKLYPDERASEAKPFDLQYSTGMKKYTFKITLDNGVEEETIPVSLHRWSTAVIDINWENEDPIMIMLSTV
ncbi:hypothetical protein MSSIT_0488 [Methanosarcina siciliae T4/M]|uniref:Uncharacterized protein n=2 Tax=Methanosarcina siciliae TaxID=38027 RepID=A0A0E3P1H1_9EURY|nr:hypothetical protein [Methanosarcina siciliae]AKB27207.1 hypothetical protein MSSIT_0488 [Methanosarcina siciliae T4/M]